MPPPPAQPPDRPSREGIRPYAVKEIGVDRRRDSTEAEELRERVRQLEHEAEQRDRNQLKQAQTRSWSPMPQPRVIDVPRVESVPPASTTGHSLNPVKAWRDILRTAGPKGAALVLVVGVALWQLGGSDGIAKIVAAWRSADFTEQIKAYEARLAALETRAGRCEAGRREDRDEEISFRADNAQVLKRMGVHWPMPDGTPPRRQLEFVTPIRRPGVVTKGVETVVMQPVPLPLAIPSSSP